MVFVQNKLYIIGGRTAASANTSDFRDLNVNQNLVLEVGRSPIDLTQPPWQEDTVAMDGAPEGAGMISLLSLGPSTHQVYFFGGESSNQNDNTNLHILDSTTNEWQVMPPNSLVTPTYASTAEYGPSVDKYIVFGGLTLGSQRLEVHGDTYLYNPSDNSFKLIRPQNGAPSGRYLHGSAMVNVTHMAIVGGKAPGSLVPVNIVHVFDTINGLWSRVPTVGAWSRTLHSSPPVAYRNQLIFYGGTILGDHAVSQEFQILDMSATPWAWRNQTVQGTLPPKLTGHTTARVGKFMIIAFGKTGHGEVSDQLYAVDLEKWQMVSTLTLREALDIPAEAQDDLYRFAKAGEFTKAIRLSPEKIAGIVIGALSAVSLVVFLVWWFVLRRWARNKKLQEEEDARPRHNSLFLFLDKLPPPEKSFASTVSPGFASPGFRSRFSKAASDVAKKASVMSPTSLKAPSPLKPPTNN
ncbi:hypothetical protein H4R34_003772 [Dimargaris verticillata]|uniref:Galactose oxidase n=1 Tax=Dimargaris verticillata TaxID=2761393 RepID=A0A9W8ECB0_9FUNG|nr:hypothetical protein H4R34_003772 [Dimargaris verticillata]